MADKKSKSEPCDCGHDHDEVSTMMVTLEDDTEIECNILGVFEAMDKEYIALMPTDGSDDVLLYEYSEVDGEINITEIETDEEFNEVAEIFDSLMTDEEMYDDDEDFDDEDDEEDDDYEYYDDEDEEEDDYSDNDYEDDMSVKKRK